MTLCNIMAIEMELKAGWSRRTTPTFAYLKGVSSRRPVKTGSRRSHWRTLKSDAPTPSSIPW